MNNLNDLARKLAEFECTRPEYAEWINSLDCCQSPLVSLFSELDPISQSCKRSKWFAILMLIDSFGYKLEIKSVPGDHT